MSIGVSYGDLWSPMLINTEEKKKTIYTKFLKGPPKCKIWNYQKNCKRNLIDKRNNGN